MDRAGLLRFLLLLGGGLLLFFAFEGWFGGGNGGQQQPLPPEPQVVPPVRTPDGRCDLFTPEFHARIRTRGATLTHFQLLTAKYTRHDKPLDLSTTPDPAGDHEFRQQLFTRWRPENAEATKATWNVPYDSIDYQIVRADSKRCELVHRSPEVELRKTFRTTGRPYELEVESVIRNLSDTSRRHAFRVDTVAWRASEEVEGQMFRISPYITHVECMPRQGDAVRLLPDEFEPKDFTTQPFARTEYNPLGDWYQTPGAPAFAATSNAYFSQALVPLAGPAAPVCLLQIEERWDASRHKSKGQDPNSGAMYRARLAYPSSELSPGATASYKVLTYVGPKERDILAGAAGGKHGLIELIDLGFFASIAKVLVAFLLKVHGVIPNWGIAIIILTLTARILLFPLSWPSIKNMIRMRELKPEMDALTEKYKDDPQARGLAQMELWRKHKVNPFKGCLPQLASMPVWFALYTTLQTAVELYNTSFLWFPDLSEQDPLYILPLIIGGTLLRAAKDHAHAGGRPDAAENDDVLHARDVHGLHAVLAVGPRRVHVHE